MFIEKYSAQNGNNYKSPPLVIKGEVGRGYRKATFAYYVNLVLARPTYGVSRAMFTEQIRKGNKEQSAK